MQTAVQTHTIWSRHRLNLIVETNLWEHYGDIFRLIGEMSDRGKKLLDQLIEMEDAIDQQLWQERKLKRIIGTLTVPPLPNGISICGECASLSYAGENDLLAATEQLLANSYDEVAYLSLHHDSIQITGCSPDVPLSPDDYGLLERFFDDLVPDTGNVTDTPVKAIDDQPFMQCFVTGNQRTLPKERDFKGFEELAETCVVVESADMRAIMASLCEWMLYRA